MSQDEGRTGSVPQILKRRVAVQLLDCYEHEQLVSSL